MEISISVNYFYSPIAVLTLLNTTVISVNLFSLPAVVVLKLPQTIVISVIVYN